MPDRQMAKNQGWGYPTRTCSQSGRLPGEQPYWAWGAQRLALEPGRGQIIKVEGIG
jgi:hypothetical protein